MHWFAKREHDSRSRMGTTRRAVLAVGAMLGFGGAVVGREPRSANAAFSRNTATRGLRYQGEDDMPELAINHLNPEGMHANPAFSQAVTVEGPHKTIYIGGQNAVDPDGNIVGVGDLAAQTEQIFDNLETVLAASGATLHDIVKWTIYIVQGQDLMPGLAVSQRRWGNSAPFPAISGVFVAALANPDFLVEIEAIAITAPKMTTG